MEGKHTYLWQNLHGQGMGQAPVSLESRRSVPPGILRHCVGHTQLLWPWPIGWEVSWTAMSKVNWNNPASCNWLMLKACRSLSNGCGSTPVA